MSINSTIDKATTTFAEVMNMEPTATTAAVGFKLGLFQNGRLGWLGQDSNEWAMIVTDINAALTLELYPYNGVSYYRVQGTSRYMSVSDRAYVGFYSWSGATGFTWESSHPPFDGGYLKSDYNGQHLSYDNSENLYLTAWDAYQPLNVSFEQV